nr:hypothetical protein Iba_chr03cCG0040 [Ipomoea batatas]
MVRAEDLARTRSVAEVCGGSWRVCSTTGLGPLHVVAEHGTTEFEDETKRSESLALGSGAIDTKGQLVRSNASTVRWFVVWINAAKLGALVQNVAVRCDSAADRCGKCGARTKLLGATRCEQPWCGPLRRWCETADQVREVADQCGPERCASGRTMVWDCPASRLGAWFELRWQRLQIDPLLGLCG